MRVFKQIAALVFALFIAAAMVLSALALPDLSKWNDAQMHIVLEDNGESNSAVDCIIIKVIHDSKTNQLHILFMTELKSFNDEINAGVKMSFNDLGDVKLYCNGDYEYDDEVFFAEINDVSSDKKSMALYIEVTVGIKQGIPDELIMDFNIYDTDGVASNTYSVDISDENNSDGEDEKSDESNIKTTKVKTTKVKTTKIKTTKAKTVKSKTTKTAKIKTTTIKTSYEQANGVADEIEYIGSSDSDDETYTVSDKKIIIIVGASAVIICALTGCLITAVNHKREK